jgi:hypothetical protein
VSDKNAKETYVTLDLAFTSHSRKPELKVIIKGNEQTIPLIHYGI